MTSFSSIALYTFTIVSIVIPLVGSQSSNFGSANDGQSNNVPAARSPCPAVFEYEPPGAEDDRWYGTIKLITEYDLHGVWIDILLDNKADLIGNWFGDVTTKDNKEFKIEKKNEILRRGNEVTVRIFVKFGLTIPRITSLRLNGRQICAAELQNNHGQSHGFAIPKRNDNNNAQELPKKFTNPTQTAPSRNGGAYSRHLYPLQSDMGVSWEKSDREPSSPHSQGTQTDDTIRRPANRPSTTSTSKKSKLSDYDYDNDENSPRDDDYFSGDFNPSSSGNKKSIFTQTTSNHQCGKVAPASVTLITQGIRTQVGQYPWHVAIYRMKHVDSTYICGGSLISRDHVLTAAHCITTVTTRSPINKNILTLHFGKSNLRTSVEGVQVKFVDQLHVHPDYASLTTGSDIAVLKLRSPVDFTSHVRAVCLWPENTIALKNVIGKPGTVVGWGFDEEGELTEDLRYANMPVIDELTCIRSFEEFFIKVTSNTTFCAGYLNGTSVCNGDSGGGMVFSMGPSNNPTWYLRGLVSLSAALQNQARCDPSHYIVFTDVAQFLPWIRSVMEPTRTRPR